MSHNTLRNANAANQSYSRRCFSTFRKETRRRRIARKICNVMRASKLCALICANVKEYTTMLCPGSNYPMCTLIITSDAIPTVFRTMEAYFPSTKFIHNQKTNRRELLDSYLTLPSANNNAQCCQTGWCFAKSVQKSSGKLKIVCESFSKLLSVRCPSTKQYMDSFRWTFFWTFYAS